MTALRHMGSVRPRALAAFSPAPRRPDHSPGHRPPDSPGKPRPPTRAEPLEPRTLLATFVVTTEADDGSGSLRQAILDANATPASDVITFAIPHDAGVTPTIRPLSALPEITTPVLIDAAGVPAGQPSVNLDGSAAGPGVDGIMVSASDCRVVGLAVFRFSRNGIVLRGDTSGQVERCHIGLTADGAPAGNAGDGFWADRPRFLTLRSNVISANGGAGVRVVGDGFVESAVISANYIGSNPAGDSIGNAGNGIEWHPAARLWVGGPNSLHSAAAPGDVLLPPGLVQNVISANGGHGLWLGTATPLASVSLEAVVWSNHIGTDAAGLAPLGNGGSGILLSNVWGFVRIGAPETVDPETSARGRPGNVIGNNGGDGITIVGPDTDRLLRGAGSSITANRIGVGFDAEHPQRVVAMPNRGSGIAIHNSWNNHVTDDDAGRGNLIAHNLGAGVLVRGDGAAAQRNQIDHNSIFANGGLGIDLRGDGPTPNDSLDADAGPNRLQNRPVLSVVRRPEGLRVLVALDGTPNQLHSFEIYASTAHDASGDVEGEMFLVRLAFRTDSQGHGEFLLHRSQLPSAGWLTATASDFDGNTSEFSRPLNAATTPRDYRPPPRPGPLVPAAGPVLAQTRRRDIPPRGLLT